MTRSRCKISLRSAEGRRRTSSLRACWTAAPSGAPYEVTGRPPCPNGHGTDWVGAIGQVEPVEGRIMTLPLVGHSRWDSPSESERRSEIDRLVAEWRRVEPAASRRVKELADPDRSEELRLRRQQGGRPDPSA